MMLYESFHTIKFIASMFRTLSSSTFMSNKSSSSKNRSFGSIRSFFRGLRSQSSSSGKSSISAPCTNFQLPNTSKDDAFSSELPPVIKDYSKPASAPMLLLHRSNINVKVEKTTLKEFLKETKLPLPMECLLITVYIRYYPFFLKTFEEDFKEETVLMQKMAPNRILVKFKSDTVQYLFLKEQYSRKTFAIADVEMLCISRNSRPILIRRNMFIKLFNELSKKQKEMIVFRDHKRTTLTIRSIPIKYSKSLVNHYLRTFGKVISIKYFGLEKKYYIIKIQYSRFDNIKKIVDQIHDNNLDVLEKMRLLAVPY
ncbi:uncharacterized protein RJT20DRAFT_28159 [Scheffersomyces xylosifermentans]|uniref:uncharacterized protein n=1 Tax=Scheffersomyces xylosifermentans TaxID=1304137 RepID=UPI00315C9E60